MHRQESSRVGRVHKVPCQEVALAVLGVGCQSAEARVFERRSGLVVGDEIDEARVAVPCAERVGEGTLAIEVDPFIKTRVNCQDRNLAPSLEMFGGVDRGNGLLVKMPEHRPLALVAP